MRPALALLLLLAWAPGAGAEQPPSRKAPRPLPGVEAELTTRDGWRLYAVYQAAREEKPTFVLLHNQGGRSQDWRPLAAAFAKRGIGYLALDLRGHARSQNPPEGQPASWPKFAVGKSYNEWENMREDIAAAVAQLKARGVPETAIALGGGDVGGSLALKYAALHPEVPMVFLLSPGMSYREVLTVNAMRGYGERPLLLAVAEDDRRSAMETAVLHEFAKRASGPERVALLRVSSKHGTQMLSVEGLAERVAEWALDPSRPFSDVGTSSVPAPGSPPEGEALPGAPR